MLKLALLFIVFLVTEASENVFASIESSLRQKQKPVVNLNESYFPSLENYEIKAKPALEKNYKWIARVIHSRKVNIPHVCTAICIEEAIFITAARCLFALKIVYTSLIYMSKRLNVIAFVIPSQPSKQAFDDIGFIVVDKKKFKGNWAVIKLLNLTNRTDDAYKWFAKLENKKYKVVGYAMKKGIHKIKAPEREYNLSELNVVVKLDLCSKILTQFKKINGFHVPCYHSCSFQQFQKNNDLCYNYHGVEGGAVVETKSNRLMGVATWGAYFTKYELPVGFSVVNSNNFFTDLTCARRIKNDKKAKVTLGYYQKLCS